MTFPSATTPWDKALAAVYEEHGRILRAVAFSALASRQAAEDCVQETVLSFCQHPERYQPARGALRNFLVVSTRNRAISMKRAANRHAVIERRLSPPPLSPDPAASVESHVIAEAMDELPPEQRDALQLAFFGELTHVEISQRLNVPLGTVKSRISLAIRKMHRALAPQGEQV